MKKNARITVLILLVSIIIFLGYIIGSKLNDKKDALEHIKDIPSFSFLSLEGKPYTQNDLPEKNLVIIYFNSTCDYCQYEAKEVQQNLHNLTNSQLLFVSSEEKESILKFASEYHLDNQQNILFLQDKESEFPNIFNAELIPYTVVYDAKGRLIKEFIGSVKINAILQALK